METTMRFTTSIAAMALALVAGQALAQTPATDPAFQAILSHPKVVKSLDDIKEDDARAFEEQKRITEIPAPPYKEKIRAEYYLKRMQELGFKDASIDSEGNVIALRKGTGGGRPNSWCRRISTRYFPKASTSP
jgi:tripeptide aminopeptidase